MLLQKQAKCFSQPPITKNCRHTLPRTVKYGKHLNVIALKPKASNHHFISDQVNLEATAD